MTVLSRSEILKARASGGLVIEPFDPARCEPASYDLALGKVLKAGHGSVDLGIGEDIIINGGEWGSIMTSEKIEIPLDMSATYGLRSSVTRRGLMFFGGPQIDPGYRGRLFVSIFNATADPIALRFGDPLFTLILHRLGEPSEPYDGQFQGLYDFPAGDVERMMKMRSKTFSDVFERVDKLDDSVGILRTNLQTLTGDVHDIKGLIGKSQDALVKILWLIVAALVAGVITGLVNLWLG